MTREQKTCAECGAFLRFTANGQPGSEGQCRVNPDLHCTAGMGCVFGTKDISRAIDRIDEEITGLEARRGFLTIELRNRRAAWSAQ